MALVVVRSFELADAIYGLSYPTSIAKSEADRTGPAGESTSTGSLAFEIEKAKRQLRFMRLVVPGIRRIRCVLPGTRWVLVAAIDIGVNLCVHIRSYVDAAVSPPDTAPDPSLDVHSKALPDRAWP